MTNIILDNGDVIIPASDKQLHKKILRAITKEYFCKRNSADRCYRFAQTAANQHKNNPNYWKHPDHYKKLGNKHAIERDKLKPYYELYKMLYDDPYYGRD